MSVATSRFHLEAKLPVFGAEADTARGSAPNEFLLRMSPHVHMGKPRHKHVSVPQTLPNMGYPCLAAKPFPMALDTCPCPFHPKWSFP